MSSDLAIDIASFALSIERTRAIVASENIANKNVTNINKVIDFDSLINSLSDSISNGDMHEIETILGSELRIDEAVTNGDENNNSLDVQVADLSSANGRYKTIADALSKKFSLMSVAVRGR